MTSKNNPLKEGRWASRNKTKRNIARAKSGSNSHSTPIRERGKVIGKVLDNCFYRIFDREKQFNEWESGYIFTFRCLIRAEQAGATKVYIMERDTGDIYTVSFVRLLTGGNPISNKDYIYGVCLPIYHWTLINKLPDLPSQYWR